MSGKLDIDLDAVEMVSTNLQTIVTRLEAAGADASSLAGAIPVHELADRVDDFAGSWDDRRKELIGQVTDLQGQADAVVNAFTDVDSQLADALTRPPRSGAPGHGRTPV